MHHMTLHSLIQTQAPGLIHIHTYINKSSQLISAFSQDNCLLNAHAYRGSSQGPQVLEGPRGTDKEEELFVCS